MSDFIKDRADWLLDAIATSTQNRQFLRGAPEYDDVAGVAILMNGEKALHQAYAAGQKALEAEVARRQAMFQIEISDAQAGFAALEAERDRLREALEKFESHYSMGINPDLDEAARLARAALAGGE